MIAPGKQARPLTQRALAAQLRAQKREDAVIARQKPTSTWPGTGLAPGKYQNFLRTGSI